MPKRMVLLESIILNRYPLGFLVVNAALACIDGALAFLAFFQLARIHMRSQQAGWTRQKVLHLMIGSSNIGYFIYFILAIVTAYSRWHCWSNACGFILVSCPKILFLAAFLLLLSFWVDLFHGADDEEDDEEENGVQQALLENSKCKASSSHPDARRRCCPFHGIHIGSRQKFVIVVVLLVFILMMSFALIIWIGAGKNPIDSSLVARVYIDIFAAATLMLGGGIGSYGLMLFLKLKKIRSEQASSEMWKVSGLTIVSVVCFTVSAFTALLTNIPLIYHWNPKELHGLKALILLVFYHFIGSSVPSAFVLWVMRHLPPEAARHRPEEPRTIAFITSEAAGIHRQHHWASSTMSKNQVSRASPI